MSVYYRADCVFEKLFSTQTIEKYVWKNINNQTTQYTTAFFLPGTKTFHSFEISVNNGIHIINGFSLHIFSHLHNIDVDDIMKNCKL